MKRTTPEPLRIGRISYLNVWPIFETLLETFPHGPETTYVGGHPSELNAMLLDGRVDLAPSSAFVYLTTPEPFLLLPDMSISARSGPIRSVHLVSPVPRQELPDFVARHGGGVLLSQASASSNALLRVLWRFAWEFPEVRFEIVPPGQGLGSGLPFVEIGDRALAHYLSPPTGRHLIDLGLAWKEFTGLPFVFALWFARRDPGQARRAALSRLAGALLDIKARLPTELPRLLGDKRPPRWISPESLRAYLEDVSYDLGPTEQASLVLFGDYCRRLGLIEAVPGLRWLD